MGELVIVREPTPNPNAMKFTANRPLNNGPTKTFYNAEAAQADPVAAELFALEGVTGVMLLGDFCSVNKTGQADWGELASRIENVLREAYQ
jgi:hypothetical protein